MINFAHERLGLLGRAEVPLGHKRYARSKDDARGRCPKQIATAKTSREYRIRGIVHVVVLVMEHTGRRRGAERREDICHALAFSYKTA